MNTKDRIKGRLTEILEKYGKAKFVVFDPTKETLFTDEKHRFANGMLTDDSLHLKICPTIYPQWSREKSINAFVEWMYRNGQINEHGTIYLIETDDDNDANRICKFADCKWFWEERNEEGKPDPIEVSW